MPALHALTDTVASVAWRFVVRPLASISEFLGAFGDAATVAELSEAFDFEPEANSQRWLVRQLRKVIRRAHKGSAYRVPKPRGERA